MLRGRVILGSNSESEESQLIEETPHLQWTLQLPGIYHSFK